MFKVAKKQVAGSSIQNTFKSFKVAVESFRNAIVSIQNTYAKIQDKHSKIQDEVNGFGNTLESIQDAVKGF